MDTTHTHTYTDIQELADQLSIFYSGNVYHIILENVTNGEQLDYIDYAFLTEEQIKNPSKLEEWF